MWNNDGASLTFTIQAPWWRRWWAYVLYALVVAAVATAAYRYRVAHLLAMERLRLRIAGNLHDDVGANLSAIALKGEMLRLRQGLDAEARRQLEGISGAARETAHTLREIVWVVNADYDTLDKLLTKMEDAASALLDGHVAYSFNRPPGPFPQRLSMDARQHVYFLYKEAVHNATKHAHASRVDIDVAVRGGMLTLTVQDDGAGFDPDVASKGNGLRLMRHRAEEVGGTLAIESAPGAGTRLTLTVRLF